MKNIIILLFLFFVAGVMSCSDKKTNDEKNSGSTQAPVETKLEDDGVVIMKQTEEDTLKGSLRAYANGSIGEAQFKITYHSPAVRGRIVWGGLVPFDKVWVTGAHMATTIECSVDFMLDKKVITAGKYGLFTIPGKDKWGVIINTNWQQHLTDEYNSINDVARIEIMSSQLTENQERLQYEIISRSEYEGTIQISWDKVQLQFPVSIKQ